MKNRLMLVATITFVLFAGIRTLRAGGQDKVPDVGKEGLTLEGKVDKNDPKVKLIVGDKSDQLPAKLFLVKLSAGKKYRISMDSNDIDSVLVVQEKTGNQLAWDDDSGGGLNSLLTLDVLKDGAYKIYAASLKGDGAFTLKVKEDGAVKVHEVGAGLKLTGELDKVRAITYNVKLDAGKTYVIDMISPDQKALDPFLRLLDARGKQLAEDDDGGEGLNARIIFKVDAVATYQIVATSFGKGRGPFTLTVREIQKAEESKLKRLARAKQLDEKVVTLLSAGKVREAVTLAEESLAIRRDLQGEKHLDYAASLNNLGILYERQANYAKAEPLLRKALEINRV
jgi:hypothetical protein